MRASGPIPPAVRSDDGLPKLLALQSLSALMCNCDANGFILLDNNLYVTAWRFGYNEEMDVSIVFVCFDIVID